MSVRGEPAPGWVGPLTELRVTPLDPFDAGRPLGDRVGMIRAVGRYGPDGDAVALLLAALAPSEPSLVRVEAAEALARRGAPAAVTALAEALDPAAKGFDPAVADAAAHALAAIGTLEAFAALGHARKEPRVVAAAERALAWLEAHHPATAAGAAPDVHALAHRVEHGPLPEEAASALARLDAGVGIARLVALAERSPVLARVTSRALAIALRRAGSSPPALALRARRVIAQTPDAERRIVLQALARDPGVAPALVVALRSKDAAFRAAAASGAALLGDLALGAPLVRALAGERDAEAFRRMADAARSLATCVDARVLAPHLDDPATAAEALLLAATCADAAPDRALRQQMRRALRTRGEPRLRVAGARALALAGEHGARPALVAALSDASADVRLAVVRALAALGGPEVLTALARHARVERDGAVLRAVRGAVEGLARRGNAALPLDDAGLDALEVRVRVPGAAPDARVLVDVRLPDGRLLRVRTLVGGEIVVADLPAGAADVRVVVE